MTASNGTAPIPRLTALLWPDAIATHGSDATAPATTTSGGAVHYIALPDRRSPRTLIPAAHARQWAGASTTARRWRHGQWRTAVTRLALRWGLHLILPLDQLTVGQEPDQTLRTGFFAHLREQTAIEASWMSISLGSPRPNQKPLILLGDEAGAAVAFVKIGWDQLTSALVSHEGAALELSPDTTEVTSPRLLDHGTWQGNTYIAMEPLNLRESVPADRQQLAAAIRAIAGMEQTSHRSVGEWIDQRIAEPDASSIDWTGELEQLVDRIVAAHGDQTLEIGSWHGDFRPWNVARIGERTTIWDWERYAPNRPVGFDALHYGFPLARRFSSAEDFTQASDQVLQQSAGLLRELGVSDSSVPAVRACHAFELLLRHEADQRLAPEAGGHGRYRALTALVSTLCGAGV